MSEYKEVIADISKYMQELGESSPQVMQGFSQMHDASNRPGALDEKTKELIALAIGVSQRCKGCIGFHTKALIAQGVTRDELIEMLNVAVYMGGGPSVMYAAEALKAYDQLKK